MLVICLDGLLFHPHLDICSYSSYIYIYKFIYFFRASYHQTLLQVKSRSPFLPRLVTRNRILNVSGYVRDWHFKCLGVMLYVSVPKV